MHLYLYNARAKSALAITGMQRSKLRTRLSLNTSEMLVFLENYFYNKYNKYSPLTCKLKLFFPF